MKGLTPLEKILLTRKDAVWLLRETYSLQVDAGFLLHQPLVGFLLLDSKDISGPGKTVDWKAALNMIRTTYSTR